LPRPKLEIADIFRRYGPAWRQCIAQQCHERGRLKPAEPRRLAGIWLPAPNAITITSPKTLANRPCPKCQGPAARDWMAARAEDLLPVPRCLHDASRPSLERGRCGGVSNNAGSY
jgi:hypothetical protein